MHMKGLEPVEKAQRKAPAPKADAPKGWSERVQKKEDRKELIERVAKEKGVTVSKDAFPTQA